ncbi:hypothetical protein MUK42_23741 [Musa troglodytarum]|uniref:Uncharacterized protein n=1 Tax=Musa troglodytarum TaxID=320322 RepID=A0A9E7GCL1_9LILI|nr:hypothetical protein MUK42_23741 [Musa troglodytarum]
MGQRRERQTLMARGAKGRHRAVHLKLPSPISPPDRLKNSSSLDMAIDSGRNLEAERNSLPREMGREAMNAPSETGKRSSKERLMKKSEAKKKPTHSRNPLKDLNDGSVPPPLGSSEAPRGGQRRELTDRPLRILGMYPPTPRTLRSARGIKPSKRAHQTARIEESIESKKRGSLSAASAVAATPVCFAAGHVIARGKRLTYRRRKGAGGFCNTSSSSSSGGGIHALAFFTFREC